MKVLSAAEIDAALDDLTLIDRLDALFRAGCGGGGWRLRGDICPARTSWRWLPR